MQKIYGFKENDVLKLLEFLKANKGKQLTDIFSEYSVISGKAKGTVRNLYYATVRLSQSDVTFCQEHLNGIPLVVSKNVNFKEDEEAWLIKNVIEQKNAGNSVRNAVNNLANGDAKLALRYQNKFRNLCKTKPQLVRSFSVSEEIDKKVEHDVKVPEFLMMKLKKEINGLVERVSDKARKENVYLKKRIRFLEAENIRLTNMLFGGERQNSLSKYFLKKDRELLN